MATGRTVGNFFKFQIDDTGGTVRDIPIATIGDVGLDYPEVDMSALQDAVSGFLSGQPGFELEFGGPYSNLAAQAASGSGAVAALSGPSTVLKGSLGAYTPLTFGIYIGIRGPWATGDDCFGITSSATSGCLVTAYKVNYAEAKYTARIRMYPGSSKPDWATTAFT